MTNSEFYYHDTITDLKNQLSNCSDNEYDTLISSMVYSYPGDFEEAICIIRSCKGTNKFQDERLQKKINKMNKVSFVFGYCV